jgi:glutamine synthetase
MTNTYPTSMVDALPSKARVIKAKEKLEKAGVKYILSCWIDLLGIPKTKPVNI